MNKNIGLDKWRVEIDIDTFLAIHKRENINAYSISVQQNCIIWYAPIMQRKKYHRLFPNAIVLTTTHALGYVIRNLRKPSRVLGILLSALLWWAASHTIFTIDIKGENELSKEMIRKSLGELSYETPFWHKDEKELKEQLKKKLKKEIAWLEIQKQGSHYLITYTPKQTVKIEALRQDELIAQSDGVIERFDLQHGNKVRKVNEYVHAGDVLVSNVVLDSKGVNEEVAVKGRVFAYVWKDVSVEMDAHKVPRAFQYFQLLMDARREVSKDFHVDDKIYKENILQFTTDMGKIRMSLHYTLIKDITTHT
ncbi:MAG: sporulation protein YqfD [Longicatena sp.]